MSAGPRDLGAPRALIVTNMWPADDDPAFGIFVREQVEALRRRLVEFEMASETGADRIDDSRTHDSRTHVRGIDVCVIDGRKSRLAYLGAIFRLRKILRQPGRPYALIHAHHVLSALAAILAGARRAGGGLGHARPSRPRRSLIVTHHGIEVLEGWQAPLCLWVSRHADKTIVTSPALAERFALKGQAPVDIIPCGIDQRRFRPGDRASARASLDLPPDEMLVAWAGTDRPEKRLWLARAAVERTPGARLVVVSGRPYSEVPTWLQAADVLVLTSTAEGSPLVVREALACGIPVVSTDVGDVRELLAGIEGCAVIGGLAADPADTIISRLAAALSEALAFSASGSLVDAETALAQYDGEFIATRVFSIWRDELGDSGVAT